MRVWRPGAKFEHSSKIGVNTPPHTFRIGQSFEDFLKDEGRYKESTAQAVKRVLAWQLAAAMEEQQITKASLARQLNTSRSQLDRLLDPENTKVTLDVLTRAAHAVGRKTLSG
ncbi:helix-turn-helix domain-containing protein [Planctomicrobium piriforme]|uniref:Helix-turn-helix domain-containing protein n=1 Tax=Planctomicrobium piriforme TaxID=1576369 RepID=A0A1I3F0G6_9PLAN|nr:helix-turn-helix transcriptional regulator [Planctomicrobium piriforme]SFI04673.1 Helix-turn-helix domain-containing protein [Planctomicrobium piriforme]